ncbi:MAG: sialate O-acetylesterase [Planctomycetota bacterium]
MTAVAYAVCCLLALAGGSTWADLAPSPWFSDDMVVQRDQPISVWGYADTPGARLTVALGAKRGETEVAADGSWRVELSPQKSGGPYELVIESGNERRVLSGVLIGDVWVCAGQSKLNFPVKNSPPTRAWFQSEADTSGVRFLRLEPAQAERPRTDPAVSPPGVWREPDAQSITNLSAIGLAFAEKLSRATGVPVGIVHAAKGGSGIESWLSPDMLRQVLDVDASRDGGIVPYASLYHGVLTPLHQLPMRGVVWYQGESNGMDPVTYQALLGAFVAESRKAWGRADLPVVVVQLPSFGGENWFTPEDGWAWLRAAQAAVVEADERVELVVTYDRGELEDVHPIEKVEVARRTALAALRLLEPEAHAAPPRVRSATPIEGAIRVEVTADAGPLRVERVAMPGKAGKPTPATRALASPAGVPMGFEVAGRDRVFHSAQARLDDAGMLVFSAEVPEPIAVRYAWSNFTPANLFDANGLPLAPYRSDEWSVPAHLEPPARPVFFTSGTTPPGRPGKIFARADERSPLPNDGRGGVFVKPTDKGTARLFVSAPSEFKNLDRVRPVRVHILILDDRTGPLEVRYDSADLSYRLNQGTPPGVYKLAPNALMTGSGEWRVLTLTFDDARFAGRCSGADIRLATVPRFRGPLRVAGAWFEDASPN